MVSPPCHGSRQSETPWSSRLGVERGVNDPTP
jgi:hypothetical protein